MTARLNPILPLGILLSLAASTVARAESVDQVIAAAEANNPDLKLAHEATMQAAAGKWQVMALVLPRVTAGAGFTLNQDEVKFDPAASLGGDSSTLDPNVFLPLLTHPDSPFTAAFLQEALGPAFEDIFSSIGDSAAGMDPIVIQPKSNWTGYLAVNQPILSAFAFPAFRSANRIYQAALADERRARQQIRGGAAKVAYGVLAAREAVTVADQGRELAKHQLALAQAQVAAGLSDNRAVLQAQLAVSRAERDWMGASQQRSVAEAAFAKVTGLPAETVVTPGSPIEVPSEATVQQALSDRADLQASQLRSKAAGAMATARNLEWLPRVDFSFTEIYNQTPGFVPEHFQWKIGVDFTWQIFDGGMRIANELDSASKRRAAAILVEKARTDVTDQVDLGWEQYHRAEAAYAAVLDEVKLAEENLRLAEASYQAGSATWLEVDGARLGLQASRLSEVLERTNRESAAIDLLVALGRF